LSLNVALTRTDRAERNARCDAATISSTGLLAIPSEAAPPGLTLVVAEAAGETAPPPGRDGLPTSQPASASAIIIKAAPK
jgi:hypothetical protein